MSEEAIREALDAARSSGLTERVVLSGRSRRMHSPEQIYAVVVTFLRGLPEEMSVNEVRQYLEDIHHEL